MVLIDSNSTVLQIGDPMPQFVLPSVDGSMVDSNRGEPVMVIVFTCNHCPYAKAVEDRLIALQREFLAHGAAFILINSNDPTDYEEDSFEQMKVRAAEKQFPFPYCVDETQEVAKAYGALCTPHCFVFGTARKLEYKGRVDDNWKDPEAVKSRDLHDAIKALVEGRAPAVREANAIGCSIKWRA